MSLVDPEIPEFHDTLHRTLKTQKYAFPWLSWRPWNLLFRKEINHQIRGKLWCKTLVGEQKFGPRKMVKSWMKNPKKWKKIGKINPEFYRNWLLDFLKCVLVNLQICDKLSKQWFAQTLSRFAKQLSPIYLRNGFVSCLSSVLERLLRCLWDVFLTLYFAML